MGNRQYRKKRPARSLRALPLLWAVLLLAGCAEGGTPGEQEPDAAQYSRQSAAEDSGAPETDPGSLSPPFFRPRNMSRRICISEPQPFSREI